MTERLISGRRSIDDGTAGADRREQILEVACELIFSKGFAAASMRDLANQIGFTQAAIYYHFDSKDAILFELIDGFTIRLLELLKRMLHESGDPIIDLRHAVRAHIMLSRTHYREIKLVIEDKKLLAKPFADRVRRRELEIYELYRARIEDVVATIECAPIAPSIATLTVLGAINFVYQWYRPGGSMGLETIADQTGAMVIGGLVAGWPEAPVPSRAARTQTRPKADAKPEPDNKAAAGRSTVKET